MTVSAVGAMSVLRAARAVRRSEFMIAADGSYAACLADVVLPGGSGGLLAERWTLAGPEPYTVSLPGRRPEERGAQVLPLADGRVLIRRPAADRHDFVLLYPAGPGTGEVPLGSLGCGDVRLLPPAPGGGAYALGYEQDGDRTGIWRVHGTSGGVPERAMTVPGRCTGGVWLDRAGRLLAVDRELDGRTKTVTADLHTGRTSPLLQLTDGSVDRLLLAEPDSGLLLLRSDATGEPRLGWCLLGGRQPVRFPEALRVPDVLLTPVAAQPGQILTPEASVVALRAEASGGAEALVLWRPGERRLHWRASPPGWLGAAGMWLPRDGLRLPYATGDCPCGLAAYDPPAAWPEPGMPALPTPPPTSPPTAPPAGREWCVLPLQQAPLARRPP